MNPTGPPLALHKSRLAQGLFMVVQPQDETYTNLNYIILELNFGKRVQSEISEFKLGFNPGQSKNDFAGKLLHVVRTAVSLCTKTKFVYLVTRLTRDFSGNPAVALNDTQYKADVFCLNSCIYFIQKLTKFEIPFLILNSQYPKFMFASYFRTTEFSTDPGWSYSLQKICMNV